VKRVVGSGGVYIELSQETSRWAQIQILDNVRGSHTMSGRTEQSPVGDFCGLFLNLGLAQVGSDNVRQRLVVCR
jgi:hypothetical protein